MKDQCDRESAIARKHGSNNMLDAKSLSSTTSVKIVNSQSVHSIEFRDNHMTVWHYY